MKRLFQPYHPHMKRESTVGSSDLKCFVFGGDIGGEALRSDWQHLPCLKSYRILDSLLMLGWYAWNKSYTLSEHTNGILPATVSSRSNRQSVQTRCCSKTPTELTCKTCIVSRKHSMVVDAAGTRGFPSMPHSTVQRI